MLYNYVLYSGKLRLTVNWKREREKESVNDFIVFFRDPFNSPINSETGSLSPSPRIVPVISSFSTIGRKSCTNSGEYGCVIVSRTSVTKYRIRDISVSSIAQHCFIYRSTGTTQPRVNRLTMRSSIIFFISSWTRISNSSCLDSKRRIRRNRICCCNVGCTPATSSSTAKCVGQLSVESLKYDGSITTFSIHRITPTPTTGYLKWAKVN